VSPAPAIVFLLLYRFLGVLRTFYYLVRQKPTV